MASRNPLTATNAQNRWAIAPRVIAGLPLLVFGVMHLSGAAPMRPILEAAGMPMPEVGAVVAPIVQVVGGLSLISGAFARIGALLAIGSMLGAIYAHLQIPSDGWPESNGGPQEPPLIYLAVAIALLSLVTLVVGAGRWSIDARAGARSVD